MRGRPNGASQKNCNTCPFDRAVSFVLQVKFAGERLSRPDLVGCGGDLCVVSENETFGMLQSEVNQAAPVTRACDRFSG